MIAYFTIENFFSIRRALTISFEPSSDNLMSDEYTCEVKDGVKLLKIGILYGANASGKSNILAAFDFFRLLVLTMHKDRTESTGIVPFLFDDTSKSKRTRLVLSFYINVEKYIYSFELDKDRIYEESLVVYESARPSSLFKRTYNDQTDSSDIIFGANLKLPKKNQNTIAGNTINNSSVIAAFGKSNVEKSRLNDVHDFFFEQVKNVLSPSMSLSGYIKQHLSQDDNGELKSFVLKLLQASDFNIEDISLNEEEEVITPELEKLIQTSPLPSEAKEEMLKRGKITNSELAFFHKAGNSLYELSEDYESAGTMRFLGMAVILNYLLKKNRFVLIDEVESSIHYELLAYFIKVFLANSNKTSQLLLTTHDINLLNEEFIRRDTIWFTDKDELGETQLIRLSNLGLHKNLSPYNAYKQGKLVKLPFLGSHFLNLND
ncbi:MAG: AAA family ATPase [Bacteroidales bacterium]